MFAARDEVSTWAVYDATASYGPDTRVLNFLTR